MKTLIVSILSMFVAFNSSFASTLAQRQYNFVDDKNNGIPITAARIDAEFDNDITKLNQKVIIASSAPSSPIAGMLWYDSANLLLKQYRNSEWVVNGVVHVATSAPVTSQKGDLWFDSTNLVLNQYSGAAYSQVGQFQSGNVGIGTTTASNGRLIVIGGNIGVGTISPGQVLDVQGTVRALGGIFPYLKYSNTQTSGTNGGTATLGSWRTCVLNTEDSDTANLGSVGSNQITLSAGTWSVRARQVFFQTVLSQIRIQNITATTTLLTGETQASGTGDNTTVSVELNGQFTLTVQSVIELQYQTTATVSNTGLGTAASFGNNIYATVELTKVS